MTRKIDSRLQTLYDAGKQIYSISKCNTIENCLYETYNTYVLHNRGTNGVYGILGSKIHDVLEQIINHRATPEDLPGALAAELNELEMLGIDFPKDARGNDSIRQNWLADMTQFCATFQPPKGKLSTEELVLYQLSENRYVQGYIDLIQEHSDGSISIYDWKTSTNFKAADLLHHGRQLVFYALAKEAEGVHVRRVAWIMLKYCEVEYETYPRGCREAVRKSRVISRGKLVRELRHALEYDLAKLGMDSIEADYLLMRAEEENSLAGLPEEVQKLYTIKPYIRNYPLTEELKQETIAYLNRTADVFESLNPEDRSQWPPRAFTKLSRAGHEVRDTFFCTSLCSHRNTCTYIRDFQEQWEMAQAESGNDNDLF